jgi:uncharacterized protein (DUF2141 family)
MRHTCVFMRRARFAASAILISLACPLAGPQQPAGDPAAPASAGCSLRIHVDGLRNSNGVVGSVIFKSPDGWPEDKSKSFRRGPTPIAPGERQATVVWDHLPPGDYGVAVIHDENRNARLDRNLIGIPREGFGFANNPHVGLSAPPFQAAIVHVHCPVTESSIHLQYK